VCIEAIVSPGIGQGNSFQIAQGFRFKQYGCLPERSDLMPRSAAAFVNDGKDGFGDIELS
jgi:hypothetical protein